MLLVACCPTGVAGAAWGPGCFVCPWAAARPRAVRAASFARRVASKPGQAPPPPTGTAAWPSGPSGALHTSGAWLLTCGFARRLEARRGPAAAHGHRSLALRSLRRLPHQWGVVADVWLCASPRSPARPRRRPRAPQPGPPDPQCGLACRAGILGRSAVCCYKRRQSKVFFVWISDPLLQTSSIRRLFR